MLKNVFRKTVGFPHLLRRMQYPILLKYLKKIEPKRVLDIGCGEGDLLIEISKYSQGMGMDVTVRKPPQEINKFSKGALINLLQADATKIPIQSGFFDCIILSSVLQMVRQDTELLEECYRVLSPGSALLLTVPVRYVFLQRLYKPNSIAKFFLRVLHLPSLYSEFIEFLHLKHGVQGKGMYTLPELIEILHQSGFEIQDWQYCPKMIGSFLYECILLIKWKLKKELSIYGVGPMALYPIGLLDRLLPKSSTGCEVLIYARRSS